VSDGPTHIDHALLKEVAAGDEQAFRQLFDALWPNVYTTALHLTKSPELSQDLAQEIFLRIWQNKQKLAEVDNIYAFLYATTRNLVTDFLRTKVFRESNRPFLINYFSHNDADPFARIEQQQEKQQLLEAIEKLPQQLKQVVTLSYLEGKTHNEIAGELGITPASSRIYLVRALAMLRKENASKGNRLLTIMWWLTIC
jgi:RNA polymerase sigma-70 factor (ECF subfamily)